MRKILQLIIASVFAIFSTISAIAQCTTGSGGSICPSTSITWTARGNLLATSQWKSVTMTSTGFHEWFIYDSIYTYPRVGAFFEVYTCGPQNYELSINWNTSTYHYRDLNNFSCDGNSNNEYLSYPANSATTYKLHVNLDGCAATTDSFKVYYRLVGLANDVSSTYGDTAWVGHVYNDNILIGSIPEYMGSYGSENFFDFNKDFSTSQPSISSGNLFMCFDSSGIDNDSFTINYLARYVLPSTNYYKITCDDPNLIKVSHANQVMWNYTSLASSKLVPLKKSTFLISTSGGSANGLWGYKTQKDTGSLKADFHLCRMDGDYTNGANQWMAYVYDSTTSTYTVRNTDYQGTFAVTNKLFGYNWGTDQPTITGERCGQTMDNNYYHVAFRMRSNFATGRYKFRIKCDGDGVGLSFRNPSTDNVVSWVISSFSTSGSDKDITSGFYNLSGDTTLVLQYVEMTGGAKISYVHCKEPSDPGTIVASRDTICPSDSVTLRATTIDGTATQWFIKSCGGTGILVGAGDSIRIPLDSTTTFYVRNRNVCINDDATDTLDLYSQNCSSKRIYLNNSSIQPPTAPAGQFYCGDSAHTFTFSSIAAGSGGSKVEWATNSNFVGSTIDNSPATINITTDTSRIDTIWIRSQNSTGCKSSVVTTTTRVNKLPAELTPFVVNDTVCKGDTAVIKIPGSQAGVKYYLRNAGASIDSANGNGDTLTFYPVIAIPKVYTIRAINATTLCYNDFNTNLSIDTPPLFYVTPSITPVACKGDNSGSVTLSVSGGTIPFSYVWNDAETSKDRIDLPAGSYAVTIADKNACQNELDTIIIIEPESLLHGYVNCDTCLDSLITVIRYGGVPPYLITWEDNSIITSGTPVPLGENIIKITDSVGCEVLDTFYNTNEDATILFFDIQVSVVATSSSSICNSISYEMTIENGSSGDLSPSVLVEFPANVEITSISCSPSYFDLSGITMPSQIDELDLSPLSGQFISSAGMVTLTYTVTVPCDFLNDIQQNQGSQILTFSFDQTVSASGAGNYYIVDENPGGITGDPSQPSDIHTSLDYPYILMGGVLATNTIEMADGEEECLEFTFSNTSTLMNYLNDLELYSYTSGTGCSLTAEINSINIVSPGYVSETTLPSPVSLSSTATSLGKLSVTGSGLPQGTPVTVEVCLTAHGCLDNACDVNFYLEWGCNDDLCMTTDPVLFGIEKKEPFVAVSRIIPDPTVLGSNHANAQHAWDNSCMNASETWQYLIENTGDAAAQDVQINLISILGTFNLIQLSDIKVYDATTTALTDTRFQPSGGTGIGIPSTITVGGSTVSNPQVNYVTSTELGTWSGGTPACVSSLSLTNLVENYLLTIPELAVGERLVFEFKTVRCCPSEVGFNQGINFNRWRLIVSNYDACETTAGNRTIAGNADPAVSYSGGPFASTFDAFGSTPNTVNDRYGISPHYIINDIGLPDLALTQLFDQSITDISAPKQTGSNQVCGECREFRVENLTFPSSDNAVTEFDTQLFTQAGALSTGASGGITGTNPRGEFKIEFELAQGVTLEPLKLCGANPTITNGPTVWEVKEISSVPQYAITNSNTKGEALFSIEDLGFTNAHEFLTFFRGSFINFNFQGCCNADETEPTIIVKTYFKPKTSASCTDCWIKLSSTSYTVQLHCPGCDVPGVIVDNYTLRRATFGYKDIDNDGRPEAAGVGELIGIDDTYPQWQGVRRDRAMTGDLLSGIAHAHFYPGDGHVSNYKSFDISDWHTQWAPDGKFTKLVFEQLISTTTVSGAQADISELGLQYESCILRYIPDGSNPSIFQEVTLGTVPSLTPAGVASGAPTGVTNSKALEKFVFDIDDFTSLGLTEFEPNGSSELLLYTQLRICHNPSKEILINVNNAAYLVTEESTLNLGSNDFPYYGGSSHGGQTQALDIIGPPYVAAVNYATTNSVPVSFDVFSVIGPTTPTYFICEGFAGSNHVYPVKNNYDEAWDNAVCQKRLDIDINSYVQTDGGNRNIFPYEYRPLPAISLNSTLFGGLNTFNVPASFTAELPAGFTPVPNSTLYRTRINIWQTPSINHILEIQPSNVLMTSTSGSIFAGGIEYNFTNGTNVKYAPPFASGVYTGYNASGGNNASNTVSFGGTPILFVGDETFIQSIKIYSDPPCSNASQSITLPSAAVHANTPTYVCGAPSANTVQDNTESHTITYPYAQLAITCNDVSPNNVVSQIFNTNQVVARIKVSATPANNLDHIYLKFTVPSGAPYTVTNVYGAFASSILVPPYSTLAGTPLSGNTSTNMAFDMGGYNYQQNDYYYVVLTLNDCNSFSPFNLITTATWACKKITDISSLNTSCSAVTCTTQFNIPQTVVTPLPVNSSYTYTPCDPLELSACFSSTNYGGAGNFAGTITLPDGVSLVSGSVMLQVGSASPVNVSTVTQTGNVVTVNLNSLTAFNSNSLLGVDGFTQDEATLCIKFKVQICTELTENIIANFTYDYYCGTFYSSPFTFDNFVLSNDPSACTYPMEVDAYHITDATCPNTDDGSIKITICGGQPPYQYAWSNSAVTQNLTSLLPGSYTVTVTDASAATLSVTYTVNSINAAPTLGFSVTDLLCNDDGDGAINLTLTGGSPNSSPPDFTYLWTGPSITALNEADEDLTGLSGGTYNLTVTYGDVCEITDNVEINEPTVLQVAVDETNVLCYGGTTGALDVTVLGGTPGSPIPYTYSWDNFATTEDLFGIAAGAYNVTVTDANGCSTTSSPTVSEPPAINIGFSSIGSCNSFASGAIDLTVTGGTAGYTYAWSNGLPTTQDQSGLASNTYTVTVTDANSCTQSASITIGSLPNTLSLGINASLPLPICSLTQVDLTPTTGISYQWSTSETSSSITVQAPGTYSVSASSGFACGTASIDVSIIDCPCEGTAHAGIYGGNNLTFNNISSTQLIQLFGGGNILDNSNLPNGGGTPITVQIAINGTLTIDQNVFVTPDPANTDLGFVIGPAPGPPSFFNIIINAGFTFTVSNTTFSTCDDYLWTGMFVNGNTTGIEMDECTVMDADRAILLQSSALYEITNTDFINNNIGISMAGKVAGINDNNRLSGCTFTSTAIIKGIHTRPSGGIAIRSCQNVFFDDGANYFSNLRCGINIFRESSVRILQQEFNNIELWGASPVNNSPLGTAIYSDGMVNTSAFPYNFISSRLNVIQDCEKGIFYRGTRGKIFENTIDNTKEAIQWNSTNGLFQTQQIEIYENGITDCRTGISCIDNYRSLLSIHDNDIQCLDAELVDGYGINAANSLPPDPINPAVQWAINIFNNNIEHHSLAGIRVQHNRRLAVYDNHISMATNNTDDKDVSGISIEQCGFGVVYGNIVEGNSSHLEYDEGSTSGWRRVAFRNIAGGPYKSDVQIYCNEFKNTGLGADIHGNNAPTQLNASPPPPGLYKFRNNDFENHKYGLYYRYAMGTGQVGTLGTIGDPNINGDANNRFLGYYDVPAGSSYEAKAYNFLPLNAPSQFLIPDWNTNATNTNVIQNESFGSPSSNPPYFWASININPTISSPYYTCGGTMNNFVVADPDNYWVAFALGLMQYPLNEGRAARFDAEALYSAVDEDTTLRNSDTAFYNFYTNHRNTNLGYLWEVKKAITTMSDSTFLRDSLIYTPNIDSIKGLLDSIVTDSLFELNEIAIHRIILKTLELSVDSLHEDDLDFITSLAFACPIEEGNAVYVARALYQLFHPYQGFDDIVACDGGYSKKESHGEYLTKDSVYEIPNVKIYPNPAKDRLIVQNYALDNGSYAIKIYDALGIEAINMPVMSNGIMNEINISQVTSGIYFVVLTRNNAEIVKKKISIIK